MSALEALGFASVRAWGAANDLEVVEVERPTGSISLSTNLTPQGRLGLMVARSIPLPNGRYQLESRGITVAIDPELSDQEQERILDLIRGRVDAEVLAALNNITALSGHEVHTIQHLTESNYYEHLIADLAEAEDSALILAPFVGKRMHELVTPFLAAAQRGVAITLLVKPETDSDDPLKGWAGRVFWPRLREGGVEVTHMSDRMHEKIVVIDDSIAYHGSLNPISHKNTTESILRNGRAWTGTTLQVPVRPPGGGSARGP